MNNSVMGFVITEPINVVILTFGTENCVHCNLLFVIIEFVITECG